MTINTSDAVGCLLRDQAFQNQRPSPYSSTQPLADSNYCATLEEKLAFPQYNPEPLESIRIPDVQDTRIRDILADCWERTKEMEVPQFRDGECEVRVLWDNAVAEAMGWDPEGIAPLRELLNNEPHVRGLGYNQYADEIEDMAADPDD